jgi:hypothetical protein
MGVSEEHTDDDPLIQQNKGKSGAGHTRLQASELASLYTQMQLYNVNDMQAYLSHVSSMRLNNLHQNLTACRRSSSSIRSGLYSMWLPMLPAAQLLLDLHHLHALLQRP